MSNATKAEGDSSNNHNKITTSTAGNKGTVLLQTASCVAFNGSKSVPVRILFDNGNQRSYLTSNLRARLN